MTSFAPQQQQQQQEQLPYPARRTKDGKRAYCKYEELGPDVQAQLKPVDKTEIFLEGWWLRVWKKDDDTCLVWFETEKEHEEAKQKFGNNKTSFKPKARVIEVQLLPIQEANKLLKLDKELEYVKVHPLNGSWIAELVKRDKFVSGNNNTSTTEKDNEILTLKERNKELEEALKKHIDQSGFKPASQLKE